MKYLPVFIPINKECDAAVVYALIGPITESHSFSDTWLLMVSVTSSCRMFCKAVVVYLFYLGNYKVEVYDKIQNKFMPTTSGLGMHVEVRDPDDRVVMSRVRSKCTTGCCAGTQMVI